MHRARPSRLKDFPYIGKYHYSLRFATKGRRRIFESAELANAAIEQIHKTCALELFLVIAYSVMPDHVHLVLEGLSDASDLRRCEKLTKQRVEYVLRKQFRIQGRWQDGYYERILQSRHAVETAVRYVLENPVRAGLVGTGGEHPFTRALSPVARTFMVRADENNL